MHMTIFFLLFSHLSDACADCHSLASCTTLYPELPGRILTSSRCQCNYGLVGDGSSCSGNSTSNVFNNFYYFLSTSHYQEMVHVKKFKATNLIVNLHIWWSFKTLSK